MSKQINFVICWVLLSLAPNFSQAASDQAAQTATMAATGPLAQSAVQPDAVPAEFLVQLEGAEIFKVSTSPVGSLTPENRARLIQQNIQAFAISKTDVGTLKIFKRPEGVGIGNSDGMLLVITDADADKAGKAAIDFAKEVLGKLQAAVSDYRDKHSWEAYAIGAVLAVFSILGLWLALYWNKRAFVWLTNKATTIHRNWKSGLSVKGVEMLSVGKVEWLLLQTVKLLRLLVMLILLYFFLPLILSFFPETRELGGKIFGYMLAPFSTIFHTFVQYIPNMFFIMVIWIVSFYILKLFSSVFALIESGELKFDWFYDDWARPTYQIVRFLVIVTAIISAYPYIPGSGSQAFQGVGLVLGAIISFASTSATSNIVAGVILTYTRAFKLNDRIKVGDTVGDVVEKTLLATRIKTIKHVVITIPNSLVMGSQIINYSISAKDGQGVILHTSITIGYDVPWQTVEALLISAALDTGRIIDQPEPFVLQTSLDDWYVGYEINAYTKEPELMAVIYSDLHRNIQKRFDAAGVEILSPHYYALRDGNASTVPSVLGRAGYTAPSFQVGKMDKAD